MLIKYWSLSFIYGKKYVEQFFSCNDEVKECADWEKFRL